MARIVARNEADVVEAVRAARDRKSTLEIIGAGTKRGLGRPVECDNILDLSQLSGIVSYEPDELVITVKAGTKITEIEDVISAKNQRLGFGPADWGPLYGAPPNSGTIGGVLSADASGSLALRYGRTRNHLLGFRAVNGFGEAYKAGGKVVKNVTGFDLPKLMCGAFGTLGAMTEVTLRIFPKQTFSLGMVVENVGPEEGLSLLRHVWTSAIEPTGLAYLPAKAASAFPGERPACALIRLEGSREVLHEKRSALQTVLSNHKLGEIVDGDWVLNHLSVGTPLAVKNLDIWRIIVPASQCYSLVTALNSPHWYADWAGGILWVGMEQSTEEIHRVAAQHEAKAFLLRADAETRAQIAPFPEEDKTHAALTRSVKAAFDPLHIFNPGRTVEGV
jgi:glycolate oxidase FAD binding subunit